jgi:CDP-4-dehydro-6-deoxyglucose reductase
MDRHLSLSQAARLIGVKRGDVQQKIQENKLVVMEGTVKLSDLKKAFPDAEYEDNTIIERMEKIMQDAVHKMAQSEREGAQVDSLSRRIVRLNKELAQERARGDSMEELLDGLKQKFMELSISQQPEKTIAEIKNWFIESCQSLGAEKLLTPINQLENQVKQFMLPHIRLLPSRHDYISNKSESLLESALRAGLAVDYGCNNGNCGKCKARLLAGRVDEIKHHDYVFTDSEKSRGYILTCCNRALTDITLETSEVVSADEIPLQTINTKIKTLEKLNNHVVILTLKTPRSQRLRFLAGQHLGLTLNEHKDENGKPIQAEYSIASCPCEPNTLQFHIPVHAQTLFSNTVINDLKQGDTITVNGPHGNFVLDEDSPNSLIFIAWDTGFAPIKSLTEHALSLEQADTIHTYWLTNLVENHYMHNLCRSWNDALDNFTYTPIVTEAKAVAIAETLVSHLHNEHQHLHNFDLYIAAPGHLNQILKPLLIAHGVKSNNLHFESTFHGDIVQE